MILVWATGLLHPVFERSKWSIFTPCVHNGDPRNSMLRSQLTISRGAAAAMAQLLCQSLLHISLRRARTIKHGYHTRVMKPDAKKRFQRLNYLILNQLPIIGRTKRVTVKNSTFKNCKRQLCFLKKRKHEFVFAAASKRVMCISWRNPEYVWKCEGSFQTGTSRVEQLCNV